MKNVITETQLLQRKLAWRLLWKKLVNHPLDHGESQFVEKKNVMQNVKRSGNMPWLLTKYLHIANKLFLVRVIENLFIIRMILLHLLMLSSMSWLKSSLESKTSPMCFCEGADYALFLLKAKGWWESLSRLFGKKWIYHHLIFHIASLLLLVNHLYRNKNCPKTDPCGTLPKIFLHVDIFPFKTTQLLSISWFIKKYLSNFRKLPTIS